VEKTEPADGDRVLCSRCARAVGLGDDVARLNLGKARYFDARHVAAGDIEAKGENDRVFPERMINDAVRQELKKGARRPVACSAEREGILAEEFAPLVKSTAPFA